MNDDRSPFDELMAWRRTETSAMSDERLAELTDEAIQRAERHRRTSRKKRLAAGIALATALSSGTAVAAAVLLREPTRPQAGIVCRNAADPNADAVVIRPSDDPVEACRSAWNDETSDEFSEPAPSQLVACVNANGTLEVIPGDDSSCASIGYAPAAKELSPAGQTLIDLERRLVDEINEGACIPVDKAKTLAEAIVADLGLQSTWQVELNSDAQGQLCAQAGIDPENQLVFISYI